MPAASALIFRRAAIAATVGLACCAPPAQAQRSPTCRGGDLSLRGGGRPSPETGEIVRSFHLRNVGGRACSVQGFPEVVLRDAAGPLPLSYRDGGRFFGTRGPARRVVLRPGRAAWFYLAQQSCVEGGSRAADVIEARAPQTTQPQRLRIAHAFAVCRGHRREDVVHIGPLHLLRT